MGFENGAHDWKNKDFSTVSRLVDVVRYVG